MNAIFLKAAKNNSVGGCCFLFSQIITFRIGYYCLCYKYNEGKMFLMVVINMVLS